MPRAKFAKHWKEIAPFFEVRGEVLFQKRLHSQLEKTKAFYEKQTANGAKGGRPRRINDEDNPSLSPEEPKAKPDETFASASAIASASATSSEPESEERVGAVRGEQSERVVEPTEHAHAPSVNVNTEDAVNQKVKTTCERFLKALNLAQGTRSEATPTLLKWIKANLTAKPPKSEDEIVAAGIMTWGDAWYADKEPSWALRFPQGDHVGKSHIDDLLAQIRPGDKFAKEIVEIVKATGASQFFKDRTAKNVVISDPKRPYPDAERTETMQERPDSQGDVR